MPGPKPGMTGCCLRAKSLRLSREPIEKKMSAAWSLHPQLTQDTIDIGDLPLCRVLVIKDANYPWLLLVPRREGAVDIIDLDEV